jgi:CRISPR-associated protein Cas1
MIKRIVEIANEAHICHKNRQLVVRQLDKEDAQVPIEDLGVLVLNDPSITMSQRIMAELAAANVAVIICDTKKLPVATLAPLEGNTLHTKTLAMQVQIKDTTKKRIWKSIVQAKVRAQAHTLDAAHIGCGPLNAFAEKVKSGDPTNIEAQAARIYWQRLFGKNFRRERYGAGANALLNYGYALMRSTVARAIVGAGLHPALGVHHRNQYNSFCLADDLIEPLRPSIDLHIYKLTNKGKNIPEISPEAKRALLEVLTFDFKIGGQGLPLMAALERYTATIRRVMSEEIKEIKRTEFPTR